MGESRVVEFGDVRYEYVDGHWWPDVTPQERVLVEELERQQAGMRQLLEERDALRAELDRVRDVVRGIDEPYDALRQIEEIVL